MENKYGFSVNLTGGYPVGENEDVRGNAVVLMAGYMWRLRESIRGYETESVEEREEGCEEALQDFKAEISKDKAFGSGNIPKANVRDIVFP